MTQAYRDTAHALRALLNGDDGFKKHVPDVVLEVAKFLDRTLGKGANTLRMTLQSGKLAINEGQLKRAMLTAGLEAKSLGQMHQTLRGIVKRLKVAWTMPKGVLEKWAKLFEEFSNLNVTFYQVA